MKTIGMEISWESFQKVGKIFEKRTVGREIPATKFPKNFGIPRSQDWPLPKTKECWSIHHWKFPEISSGLFFNRMHSVRGYPLSVNSKNAVSFAAGNLRNSSNSVIFGRMRSSLFRVYVYAQYLRWCVPPLFHHQLLMFFSLQIVWNIYVGM